ncbi:ABC transporter permease, partial [Leisingera sp.]|uniref:ABC transporter permease n=1 Tax=Leisingera sp. TaxID=1879318 RepID=UPI003A5BEEA7
MSVTGNNTAPAASKLSGWLSADYPKNSAHARAMRIYASCCNISSNLLAMTGLAIVTGLIAIAIFAPILAPHDPMTQDLSQRLLPPGSESHLLGTDELGRDILSRLIHGSRITLYIVGLVALIAPTLGLLVGGLAGYAGSWPDAVLMRVTDV